MLSLSAASIESDGEREWATFDNFWTLYPRKVARKDALQAWTKLGEPDREAATSALVAWRRVWIARGEERYIPYPATWLRGERWTDELPSDAPNPAQARTRELLDARSKDERTAPPPEFHALMAKLRGRS